MDDRVFNENQIYRLIQNKKNFVEVTGNIIFSNKITKIGNIIEKVNDITNEGVVILNQREGVRRIKYQGIFPSKNLIEEVSYFDYDVKFKENEYDKYLKISSENINHLELKDNDLFSNKLNNYINKYNNNCIIEAKKYISYYFNGNNVRILQENSYVTGNILNKYFCKKRDIFARNFEEFLELLSFESSNFFEKLDIPMIPFKNQNNMLLLSPEVAAIVFHEVCHLFEYDKDCILPGTKLSSNLLNVFISPSSENSYVNFTYDDEGIHSQKIQLIKNGIALNNIHSKITALNFENVQCGYGRRPFFQDSIAPRMANIIVEKDNNASKDVFHLIKDGLYIERCQSGLTNKKNRITKLNGISLFKIKNGEISEKYNVTSLQFNLLDFLKNIVYIGSEIYINNGMCCGGLPVSYGSPDILSSEVKVW